MLKTQNNNKSIDKEVKNLLSEINMCDFLIESDDSDHGAFYQKGIIFVKLFNHTKDMKYGNQGLEALNRAIELTESKDKVYLVARSKLYAVLGQSDLAIDDVVAISKLPKGDIIEDGYSSKVIRDISELADMKKSIDLLRQNNQINPELANILEQHARITSYLVIKTDDHANRLSQHDEEIRMIKMVMAKLEQGQQLSAENMIILDGKITGIQLQTDKQGEAIDNLNVRVDTLATELGVSQSQMDQMIEEMNNYGITQEGINELLPFLGQLKMLITNQISSDQSRQMLDVIMNDPYKGSFYDTLRKDLNSTYLAATVVQTNIVKNSKTGVIGKVANVLETAAQYIPMFGGVQFFALVLSKVDELQQAKFVRNYANLASTTSEMENLSSNVAMRLSDDRFDKSVLDRNEGSIKNKLMGFLSSIVKGSAIGVGKELIDGDIEGAISKVAATAINKAEDALSSAIAEKTVEKSIFKKWNPFKKKDVTQVQENRTEEKEVDRMEEIAMMSNRDLGTAHAHIVSSLIIGKVFDGTITMKNGRSDDCVTSIESFLYDHLGLDTDSKMVGTNMDDLGTVIDDISVVMIGGDSQLSDNVGFLSCTNLDLI